MEHQEIKDLENYDGTIERLYKTIQKHKRRTPGARVIISFDKRANKVKFTILPRIRKTGNARTN